MNASRTISIIGFIFLPYILTADISTHTLLSLVNTPETTKKLPTEPFYTSLLEQLFDATPQQNLQNNIQSNLEPWILQLFGQQLDTLSPVSSDQLDATIQKREALLSILSLSLQEYRKNTKKELL